MYMTVLTDLIAMTGDGKQMQHVRRQHGGDSFQFAHYDDLNSTDAQSIDTFHPS